MFFQAEPLPAVHSVVQVSPALKMLVESGEVGVTAVLARPSRSTAGWAWTLETKAAAPKRAVRELKSIVMGRGRGCKGV